MSIDDLFKVSVRVGTVAVSAPGFETVGLFVGTKIPLETPEVVSISRVSEVSLLDDTVYPVKAIRALANVYFGQERSPTVLKIYGMGDTVHYTTVQLRFVSAEALARLKKFQCVINGVNIDATVTGADTEARLLSISSAIAAADPFDGPTTITSDEAGLFVQFQFTAQRPGALIVDPLGKTRSVAYVNVTGTAGSGGDFADLFAKCMSQDSDIFWVVNAVSSTAMNAAFAAEVSAMRKMHSAMIVTSRGDTGVGTTSFQDGVDHANTLKGLSRVNTLLTHSYGLDAKALGIAAVIAPWEPGRITAMYKRIRGCLGESYTSQQVATMKTNRLNAFIVKTKDISIYQEGFTSGPEFVDIQSGIWWIIENVQVSILGTMLSNLKVEYNDYGMGLLKDAIERVFVIGRNNRLIETFTVTPPTVDEIPLIDKQTRKIQQIPFRASFKVTGAIHFVDVEITMEL